MIPASVDLLVVGCGPAGASAAAAAAARGLAVLVVERRREVGAPVQCAEFIPLPLAAEARGPGIVQQPVRGMNTCLPSGAWHHHAAPGLMIDRAAFDQALAAKAVAAGARMAPATALLALDAAGGKARLAHAGGVAEVAFRLLIAADGPRSTVARLMGLAPLPVIATRQYTVPLGGAGEDTDIWLGDAYRGGYAWLFPRGRVANLGVGMAAGAPELKAALDTLHDTLVRKGRVARQVLRATGGPVPVGGLRPELVAGRVLFAGDAAGLAHPVSGAGIAAAVASGRLSGAAAAGWLGGRPGALAGYAEEIRDVFGPGLARALARRAALWSAPARNDADFRRGWVAFDEYFAPGEDDGPPRLPPGSGGHPGA